MNAGFAAAMSRKFFDNFAALHEASGFLVVQGGKSRPFRFM